MCRFIVVNVFWTLSDFKARSLAWNTRLSLFRIVSCVSFCVFVDEHTSHDLIAANLNCAAVEVIIYAFGKKTFRFRTWFVVHVAIFMAFPLVFLGAFELKKKLLLKRFHHVLSCIVVIWDHSFNVHWGNEYTIENVNDLRIISYAIVNRFSISYHQCRFEFSKFAWNWTQFSVRHSAFKL